MSERGQRPLERSYQYLGIKTDIGNELCVLRMANQPGRFWAAKQAA
jgi:hypothetical protein